jgi:hypothetical protein
MRKRIHLKKSNSAKPWFMAGRKRIITLPSMVVLAALTAPGQAATFCNPVVDPSTSDTTLIRALSRIAEEYEFKLTVPESLDRPISFNNSMTLERLVKHLTKNMSTVLKHRKVDGCATPVLTHLIVLPVGKEAGVGSNSSSMQEQTVDYIYIDDMELYVTNVLQGKQQADLEHMTPEQREEFRIVRDTLTNQAADAASQLEQPENAGAGDTSNPDQAAEGAANN